MCLNNELITVIIPVYNVEEHIEKCIISILNQTYTNLEILVIDDGSTDNSYALCKEICKNDSRVKVITKSNTGIATTRNFGVKNSNGEYIFWIDSDDYVAPNIIEILYKNIKSCNADMSICDYIQGHKKDYTFGSNENKTSVFDEKKGLDLIYENDHFSFIMAASWAKLIKKSLYDGLVYPDGKIFEDIYMSHKLISKCNKIIYSNSILYYYYKWPESILGKKFNKNKLDYLGAFEERIEFFDNLGYESIKEKALHQYLHALTWEYSRAKDLLKDKNIVNDIKKQYRKYYKFGMDNVNNFKHETKSFMFWFYINPWLVDFYSKLISKIRRSKI